MSSYIEFGEKENSPQKRYAKVSWNLQFIWMVVEHALMGPPRILLKSVVLELSLSWINLIILNYG